MSKTLNQLLIVGFVFGICILSSSIKAYSQEKTGFGHEENLKGQDELNTTSEQLNTSNSSSSNALIREREIYRDSVSIKNSSPTKAKTEASNSKKSEDETLSYNLLYFIIQKFKVSDMIN